MRFVIITGLSGAGKSNAIRVMEDIGFYCIDNMPPSLLPKFVEVSSASHTSSAAQESNGNFAFVIDLRSGDIFDELFTILDNMSSHGINFEILFLDAGNEVLIKRYKQTRRAHPLSGDGQIIQGINREREMLAEIRRRAKYIIDTSALMPIDLREEIIKIFSEGKIYKGIVINVMSFGFKYGIPLDADLVFDVRFLPNPFYVAELKQKTGMNKDVRNFVFSYPQTEMFLKQLEDMIDFLIPYYIAEGKNQLVICIGCTGGKHRSVAISEALHKHIDKMELVSVINHRDYLKG